MPALPADTARKPAHRRVPAAMCAILALGLLLAGGAQAQTRIGYVEMKRLLDNAPQMTGGSARLQAEFAERDRQLKADETRLEELQRQARDPGHDEAASNDEIAALDRRIRRTREALREELRRRSEQEVELQFRRINETVAAYAREQNYDLIVHSPVFYASPSIDITDQILARLRELHATDDD